MSSPHDDHKVVFDLEVNDDLARLLKSAYDAMKSQGNLTKALAGSQVEYTGDLRDNLVKALDQARNSLVYGWSKDDWLESDNSRVYLSDEEEAIEHREVIGNG